jgi:hypothetical protein
VSPDMTTGASTSIIIGSFSRSGIIRFNRYSISELNKSAYSFLFNEEISDIN